MRSIDLPWLPPNTGWAEQFASLAESSDWADWVAAARSRLTSLEILRLDRRRAAVRYVPAASVPSVRLAVLASSTIDHVLPAIRVGAMRRGLFIETFTPAYGQYAQELQAERSDLARFAPTAVLFALDGAHLLQGVEAGLAAAQVDTLIERSLDRLAAHWGRARQRFGAQIIQQVPVPAFVPLLGGNEHRLPGSRAAALARMSQALRGRADAAGVDLVALDDAVARDGLADWHDRALWHRAKQEVHPQAAPLYGDLVARVIAAAQGRSSKCLVLDLDNTLWGGVIGDDGLAGIKLGQGSAAGEAFTAFQEYARDLGRRGIILAVCSKNDEANALEPFQRHPEMVLKRPDIACFIANWTDKASNLREIARRLNIGLDSLVFADDNPAERAIVRRELPMVEVPELPEDPSEYPATIALAGYFESTSVTEEDRQRAGQYQANLARENLVASATDMDGYLRSLQMQAHWNRFDRLGQARIVQLINKTNQFNLTTRRVTDEAVAALIADDAVLTLQIRLLDQFGDNGIIGIVIAQPEDDGATLRIDTWLMSCRVLGRGVEEETLNLIAAEARRLGAVRLLGEYRPTAKNGMVRDHYARLGFVAAGEDAQGATFWTLDLATFEHLPTFIESRRVEPAALQPA